MSLSIDARSFLSAVEETTLTRLKFRWHVAVLGLALVWSAPCSAADDAPAVPLSLSKAVTNHLDLRPLPGDEWELRTTGGDPFVEIPLPELANPSATPVLALEYFCPQGVTGIELRVRAGADWPPPIDGAPLDPTEGWGPAAWPLSTAGSSLWDAGGAGRLRIDFGTQAGVTLRVRELHLRPPSEEELKSREEVARERERKRRRADEIAAYLDSDFPASVSAVAVGNESLRISGYRPQRRGTVWLAEIPLHRRAAQAGHRSAVVRLDETQCDQRGNFEVELPRYDSGRDRIASRWQVVVESAAEAGGFEPLSHASYATDLSGIGNPRLDPPPELKNAKGLGGISPVFGLGDLLELGVQHITVNVVVTGLLSDVPAEDRESFTHNGRPWWINSRRLIHIDRTLAFAAKHGITVAAIVLLPTEASDTIVHPEANRAGVYAMPNLDDAEAAEKYEAVLAMLAQRYAGGPRGRIDHWIMHNEIDFGWTWTNMGYQPLEIYLETYVRSMRIAYLQARRFNRFAKVFVSLTHHWNVPQDEQWKTYPPREILNRLAQFNRVEGDFGWGVAYHPYPESLWNSRTWEDATVKDDFDTPRITMKNIDVLQRFMERPEMRDAAGNVRPVLLSEQGYHTDGYGETAQRNQAAALLYTWERLRSVDGVIAYDYHRWVDAAEEGGLLLGLRTLPSKDHPAGEKKLGWEVFKAIGTEEEAQWKKQLADVYPSLDEAPPSLSTRQTAADGGGAPSDDEE